MNTSCPPVARSILDVIGRTPLVELTSDNTGTGLAVVCSALGHPFVALISRGNFVERVQQVAPTIEDLFVDAVESGASRHA